LSQVPFSKKKLLLSFGSAIPNQLHWTSSKAFKAFCLFIANLDHNFPWLSVCRCSASGMYLNEVNKELFPTQGTCYLEIKKISKSCLVPILELSIEVLLIFWYLWSTFLEMWKHDMMIGPSCMTWLCKNIACSWGEASL
jgi:hypothetical protein